jgi:hypothetical protein
MMTQAAAGMLAQAPGAVLLSRVSDRREFLVPQALIDDPPAFRSFLDGQEEGT